MENAYASMGGPSSHKSKKAYAHVSAGLLPARQTRQAPANAAPALPAYRSNRSLRATSAALNSTPRARTGETGAAPARYENSRHTASGLGRGIQLSWP